MSGERRLAFKIEPWAHTRFAVYSLPDAFLVVIQQKKEGRWIESFTELVTDYNSAVYMAAGLCQRFVKNLKKHGI